MDHPNAISKECLIDELAYGIGKDPLLYRLELLEKEVDMGSSSQRDIRSRKKVKGLYKKILHFIQENAYWKGTPGQGLAIQHFGDTVCAQIAEVTMDGQHGYTVQRVTAIVSCGTVVNPHFATGQVEGGIIWALTALYYGGINIENGQVVGDNFDKTKVIRMDESPKIDVIFLESQDPPTGLGEPGVPPLAPAVLNAIFSASGKRIRKIPVTPDDLKNS